MRAALRSFRPKLARSYVAIAGDRMGFGPVARGLNSGCSLVCPATGTATPGSVMAHRSSRYVIVAKRATEPFAQHCEILLIGREYRFADTLRLRSGVTLCDLIEKKGEGL
jgi:hypothetical protein